MKMLFFSADEKEVLQVGKNFRDAGINCEIRYSPSPNRSTHGVSEAELWIKDDRDCHKAFMLCVQLSIGFAKRPYVASIFDIDEQEEGMIGDEAAVGAER